MQIILQEDKHETLSLPWRLGWAPKSRTEASVEYANQRHPFPILAGGGDEKTDPVTDHLM